MTDAAVRLTAAGDSNVDALASLEIQPNYATANANGEHPLTRYFGAPLAGMDFDPRDKRYERNFTLPKAYEGRNEYLGEIVNGLILEDGTFYTSNECLPIRRTDQMNFSWSSWQFDAQLMNPVPEEGVSRLIRSTYSRETAATRRYGLAFVVEHGFWKTAEGRTHYVRSLQQIANSTLLSINLEVLVKLVQVRAYDVEWQVRNGIWSGTPEEVIEQQVQRFAALQKGEMAAEYMVDKALMLMKNRGVNPTTLIIPGGTSFYFRGVGPDKINYSNAGPLAVTARTQDIRSVNSFRGISVHQTQTFNLNDPGQPAIDPLIRTRMIGEYHVMDARAKKGGGFVYDIEIHDANADEMVTITIEEALANVDPAYFASETASRLGHVGATVGGNVDGDVFVHAKIKDEHILDKTVDQLRADFEGVVDADALEKLTGHVGAAADAAPVAASADEIKEMHAANTSWLEANVEPVVDGAKKYNNTHSAISDAAQQARFVQFVGSQIKQGADSVNQNVIANLDLLSGNKFSKAYKSALKKLTPEPEQTVAAAVAPPAVYSWVAEPHFDANEAMFTACDPVTKEACSKVGASITKAASVSLEDSAIVESTDFVGGDVDAMRVNGAPKLADHIATAKAGGRLPFDILLIRPLQEFTTQSAILMRGGRQTGEALLGESSVLLGDDVTTKRHYANFTLYWTAVVYDKKAVHIMDDVCVQRYLGGRSSKFLNPNDQMTLMNNWSMVPPQDKNRGSLIPIVIQKGSKVAPYIDVRGTWADDGEPGADAHYSSAKFYYDHWELGKVRRSLPTDPEDNSANTTLCRGHSNHYNTYSGMMNSRVLSKGHFGRNGTYAGMMEVLQGTTYVLKDMEYEREKVQVVEQV